MRKTTNTRKTRKSAAGAAGAAELRRRLHEAETRCRTLIDHLLDGILIIDASTALVADANEAALRLFGAGRREDLVGRLFDALLPCETVTDRGELIRRLKVHGHVFMEQRFRRADGSAVLADLSASMVEWGGTVCILMVLRDAAGRADAMLSATPLPGAVGANRSRVLIAEDQAPLLHMFGRILTANLGRDITVDLAEDGEQAVRLFKKYHHTLVLLDVQMPVKGGDVAFLEIEQWCHKRRWEMPAVVFCTGYNIPATIRALVEASPRHTCLLKPVEAASLLETIRTRLPPRDV